MEPSSSSLRNRRIAFFHHSADMYGADKVLLDIADGVRRHGAHPIVLLPGAGPLTNALSERGIEWYPAPMLKISRAALSVGGLLRLAGERQDAMQAYDALLAHRSIDLVHSNTIAVLGGALWARSRRIPQIWHIHEIIDHPWIVSRLLPKLVCHFADKVICNSYATARWLRAAEPALAERSAVVWNGVHAAARPPTPNLNIASQFRPKGVTTAIGLVGRINRWKGHRVLIDAADVLHRRGYRDFSVVFVGSPPPGQDHFRLELVDHIRQSLVAERVVLRDFDRDIWQCYQALDIACVPSIDPEPFGLVAIEAMAAGLPVVASGDGGLAEIVIDNETGIQVPPRDAEALADAIARLLDNVALRARMGAAGRRRYLDTFALAPMQDAMVNAYASLLGQAAPSLYRIDAPGIH